MIEVNIIGTGNVAWHLAKAFASENQIIIMQISGRNPEVLKSFSKFAQETVSLDQLSPAQVNIIAVGDDSIPAVIEALPFSDALVVHTSGFTKLDVYSKEYKSTKRNRLGVFYPLQSFSKEDQDIHFSEIPILIEAQDLKDLKTLRILAEGISTQVKSISSEQRRSLHLAAVFANNFTNHLFTIAQDLCRDSDVPFSYLHALIMKTAAKAILHNPSKIQTGPAIRGDSHVLTTQEHKLSNPEHKEIYRTITKALKTYYGKKL